MKPIDWDDTPIGECTKDPERWTTTADEEAKAICRQVHRHLVKDTKFGDGAGIEYEERRGQDQHAR